MLKKEKRKKTTETSLNLTSHRSLLTSSRGITLIALIITIIVMIILVAVTVMTVIDGKVIETAGEASFKQKMATYQEQTVMYVTDQIARTLETNTDWINAGEALKEAIQQEIVQDITEEDVTIDIKEILPTISSEEERYLVVYKGELHYVSNTSRPNNSQQRQWCEELGIPILEFIPPPTIEITNGGYENVNGVYLCTPDLTYGFEKTRTRYLEVDSNGNLVPGKWLTDDPTENWYSYKDQKWANVYVENDGEDSYYVWIPRYCFKLDQDTQRSDVKFLDVNNNYKDEYGRETSWAALEAEGYQVPEAFTFNGTELAGFWVTKYTTGDAVTPNIINYDMAIKSGVITLKNISLNTTAIGSNTITKYTVALNGDIVHTIENSSQISNIGSQVIELNNLKPGDNIINITGLNSKGEIVGSMTKEYSSPVVNKPDLTGFDPDTTFYVTYDANGKEHSTVPISQESPANWYDYGASEWANIVTRNNQGEVYYVWIPRYQFKLDQDNQRSTVKFITGTGTETDAGYQIPEAFTFKGTELAGYWITKYPVGDIAETIFTTEIVATSNSLRTKGITGTGVASGQTYNYYINGELRGSKTNASEEFEFTGLSEGTEYTVLIEIRNSSTDEYIGTVARTEKTQAANKPDLSSFNAANTYYVLYDESGTETIGDNITNDGSNMPSGWYDYSSSKWANIVVQTNGITTYYTWIPRYQFRLDKDNQRSLVKFIEGTGTETEIGYQIPAAFTFNGKEITGYWVSKYTVGE